MFLPYGGPLVIKKDFTTQLLLPVAQVSFHNKKMKQAWMTFQTIDCHKRKRRKAKSLLFCSTYPQFSTYSIF